MELGPTLIFGIYFWRVVFIRVRCSSLTFRDNLISLGRELKKKKKKTGPDVFTPLEQNLFCFSSNYYQSYFLFLDFEFVIVY